MPHPDAWLFLPPEVEALVPPLLARLAATGGGSADDVERDLRNRIETLILEGDAEQWRTFLREATTIVAEYAGNDAEARTLLASILDDQFLLARAVVDLEDTDLDARRQLARAGATPPRSSRT
ncbi:hypothetical protein [Nocardioides sp.]|uniref:hypothetical protein n=1 Tax=Nocardioides sp. TaxID=35761 RepID=UPI002F423940